MKALITSLLTSDAFLYRKVELAYEMAPSPNSKGLRLALHLGFPFDQPLLQVGHDLWVSVMKIVSLTNVRLEIEEQVHGAAIIKVFPLSMPHRPHFAIRAVDAPKQSALGRCWSLSAQDRSEVHAIEAMSLRRRDSGSSGKCSGEIHGDRQLGARLCPWAVGLGQRIRQGTRIPPSQSVAL